jgi:SecY interacting protein Syd
MPTETEAALGRLIERYIALCHRQLGSLPTQAYDPAWISPCQVGEPNAQGMIYWQPVERAKAADFSGMDRALETEIHPDIKSFFGSFWCDVFDAQTEEGGITLIQVWNPDDFDRLCENILGHAFAKQRINAPLTIFFACTDEDDLILSVENDTGKVVLENPGHLPIREVAASLAEFLNRVEPVVKPESCDETRGG